MNKVAILQSNYIPWKGVFDMINQVDTFVFLEDVQFTKRDWRSRNKIKTPNGDIWLTVPVKKTTRDTLIYEVEINNDFNWQKKHYESFRHNYSKAPFFDKYKWIIDDLYKKNVWTNLSSFNIYTTKLISDFLGIKTNFVNSKDINTTGTKDDKLIEICKKVKGDVYLSGPAAKDYIIEQKFIDNGIKLEYINYEYPRYKQQYKPFNHFVTILDLIFNVGDKAPYYIWGWRKDKGEIEYDTL